MTRDVLIGVDAGTSVIKAVAFDLTGAQLAVASRRNSYATLPNGGVEQDMRRTWTDTAAVLAELGGADGITVHLRGDRRHIQDRDVEVLRRIIRSRFNLRMSATQEMVRIALTLSPDQVTLVPERTEKSLRNRDSVK